MSNTRRGEVRLRNIPIPHPTLEVTQEMIDKAIQASPNGCMMSMALRACESQLGYRPTYAWSDVQTIRWTDKARGLRYCFQTPLKAALALKTFDEGNRNAIVPFKVRLLGGHAVQAQSSVQAGLPTRARLRVGQTRFKGELEGGRIQIPGGKLSSGAGGVQKRIFGGLPPRGNFARTA